MERIKTAISYIIMNLPFFVAGLLKLEIIESDRFPTAAVDGKRMFVNPEFFAGLTIDEIIFVLCHEVMHCLLLHHLRMRGRDHSVWNEATDYQINYILAQYGLRCPAGCLYNTKYGTLASEIVYDDLMGQRQQQQQQDQQDDQQGDSQQGGDDAQEQGQDGAGSQDDDQQGDGQGEGEGAADGDSGDSDGDSDGEGSGGASGQESGEGEDQQGQGEGEGAGHPDPGMAGGVIEPDDMTDEEIEAEQIDWQTTMAQSYEAAQKAGNMPGSVKRMIDEIMHPSVDWRDETREMLEQVAANDYSFNRPNVRFQGDVIMPSLQSQDELGKLVIVIDTSMSMTRRMLAFISAEVSSILDEFPTIEATVIYCDTRVAKVEEYTHDDLPISLGMYGGGGTDFRPPFDYVEKHDLDPVGMIYFTDLWCYTFPAEPAYPVIWAATDMTKAKDVPFGSVTKVNID